MPEQSESEPQPTEPSRRALLAAGTAAAAVGAVTLAGCGSSSSGGSGGAGAGSASTPAASSGGAPVLAPLTKVPVGGSAANDSGSIVIAQPTAGQVVAFSSKCTHMGCTVAPAGAEYHCPCHGSVYDAFTGAVKSGPAPRSLSKVPVTVTDGNVVENA